MSLPITPGSELRTAHELSCDVAIVGSGPAGSAVARALSRAGASVIVLEEGAYHPTFAPDGFSAMAALYRDMGASVTTSRAPSPFVQGRAVGGGSVINGAISWRLPRHVHREWVAADSALERHLSWEQLEAITDQIETDLHIRPTDPSVSGPNNLLLGRGAEALGLSHRPISRYTRNCVGRGHCLQGCPVGAKMSMDQTYLAEATRSGAQILSECRVERVLLSRGGAVSLGASASGGGRVTVRADRVVLAASAIQTPLLLLASGLRDGPVGQHFQCHPGVSVIGRFPDPIRMWTGATQGHEVTGLVSEGIKFEALGFDMSVLASRVSGVGPALSEGIADFAHLATWGAAVRAEAEGRVERGWWGRRVRFDLRPSDMVRVRRAVAVLGEMMLAAGAEWVAPGVHGWDARVSDPRRMAALGTDGPLDPRAYASVITHMFGTCRMGSDPTRSVVRPDGRHHRISRLYIADSSVFPSNTGVNPQTSILAIATSIARGLASG